MFPNSFVTPSEHVFMPENACVFWNKLKSYNWRTDVEPTGIYNYTRGNSTLARVFLRFALYLNQDIFFYKVCVHFKISLHGLLKQ